MANGYVRYGNSIHLDGFEILDFCIENAISLESLRDLNLGRKVFLTGNDTNAGYLREHVWDGDHWRATAYLDDIDKITNGEGSLGTRVKALEDMLKMDDANDAINTWAEIQKFLENIDEGLDLMTMLDDKLSKSEGGTITGKTTIRTPDFGNQLCLDITNDSSNLIRFQKNGTNMGFIGFNSSDEPIYADKLGHSKILLHEGNVGDYTAGAAKKLETAVSLWGNEFDGTKSLSNSLILDNNKQLRIKDSAGVSCSVVGLGSDNNLLIGGDLTSGTRVYNMYLDGYKIYFRTGAKQTAMTITEGGNINVGDSYLSDVLFSVKGLASIYVSGSNMSLDDLPDNGLVLGGTHYTLAQFLQNSGNFAIQSYRKDTASALALNLNPLGGAVNVGDGGLNVAGTTILGKIVAFTTGETYYERAGANYLWASKGGYFVIGVGANAGLQHAALAIYNNKVMPGNRNNEISLGASSYRWSNVYSTLGDFSGRVLIGTSIDDGNSKLNVAGDVKITRSNDVGTYLGITVSDILTTFNALDGTDNYMRYSFQSHGTELLRLDGKEGGTSYFRTLVGFDNLATFNGGALIPTGQKLTIGDANGDHATIEYDSIAKAIKVDGNLFTTGTLASGGKAKEGTGTGSGSANVRDFELPADGKTTYDCDHLLKSKNVIVQVFEKAIQTNIEVWEMILTDVTIVTEDRVTVTFGRPTTKVHKVHIIGGNIS